MTILFRTCSLAASQPGVPVALLADTRFTISSVVAENWGNVNGCGEFVPGVLVVVLGGDEVRAYALTGSEDMAVVAAIGAGCGCAGALGADAGVEEGAGGVAVERWR